jgi:hypothetical protein
MPGVVMKLFAMALLSLLPLQSGSANVLGTWTAEKGGITFARLELRSSGNSLSGALTLGDISVDKTGGVGNVKPAPATMTPLEHITVANGVVSFIWHRDSDEDRFRFQVIADGAAELSLLLPGDVLEDLKLDGITPPKPIVLRKAP